MAGPAALLGATPPPPLLQLAAHPLRWRLLCELAGSDRRVGELCALSARPQSLVSYHLRRLREGGLVSMRRSTADGRDTYYVLDLERCRELLADAGRALHPGLMPAAAAQAARADVLFLCTGNSARSQIAASLAGTLSGGAVRAVSAGSNPKPLHPNALRVLRDRGLPVRRLRPKHLSEFADRRFDYVITLCDRVREVCPEFPGGPASIHWSIPDPGREPGTDEETLPAFERVADELTARIGFLLDAIAARPINPGGGG
jgi:ArsR family transcriptional regulator, arsenate/arsenite/antimonite-responsive transcriptional repressor / arsenate reductase (thioredoxin)